MSRRRVLKLGALKLSAAALIVAAAPSVAEQATPRPGENAAKGVPRRAVRGGLGARPPTWAAGTPTSIRALEQGEHFWSLLSELGLGLRALYQDLASTPERFGRRHARAERQRQGRRAV